MSENTSIEEVGQQLEMFERSVGGEMTLTEFAEWVDGNVGPQAMMKLLQIATFMACCDVKAQDISKATLKLRQRLENNTTKVVMPRKHPLAGMLALEPNQRHTWKTFTEMMVYWLCFTNNAGAVIIRAMDGTPLELIPLQTGRINVKVNGREIFYEVTASTQQEQALLGTSFLVVPERDFIHVRSRTIDGMYGFGNDVVGKETFQIMQNINQFRNDLFNGDGQQRGVFTRPVTDAPIPEQIFQRLRQQYKELMNRYRKIAEPVILEGGIEFKSIASKPSDMELSTQMNAQILEICRMTRTPPHKIFLMDGSKYSNMETAEKSYVSDALIPIALDLEGEYSKKLMTRDERLDMILQYERSEMMVKDTAAETDRTIRALERGTLLVDEARAVFGYNPLPGGVGQVRLIPTNMTVVDRNGEVLIGGASTPASDVQDPKAEQPPAADNPDEEKSAPTLRLVQ